MRKKVLALLMLVIMISIGCTTFIKKEQFSEQKKPTIKTQINRNAKSEKISIDEISYFKEHILGEFENAIKLNINNKEFVFYTANDKLWPYSKHIVVIRLEKGVIDKIYKSEGIFSDLVYFGFLNEPLSFDNGIWGRSVNRYSLLPVTFKKTYPESNNDFYIVKMLAINDNNDLVELETFYDDIVVKNPNRYFENEKIRFRINVTLSDKYFESAEYIHPLAQEFEYGTTCGLKLLNSFSEANCSVLEKVKKVFEVKDIRALTNDLSQKILRIYNDSLISELSEKYKYELQIIINRLKEKPEYVELIERMHKKISIFPINFNAIIMEYVRGLPSALLSWDVSEVGSKEELVFTNDSSIRKMFYDQIKNLLPKNKNVYKYIPYYDKHYSYIFIVVDGDSAKRPKNWFGDKNGKSLMLFIFLRNELLNYQYVIENTGDIDLYDESFYNRGDPYYDDYINMNLWGLNFHGGKIFSFINHISTGNCWACAVMDLIWVEEGKILDWKFEPNIYHKDFSIRGISLEDGELICYRVLWGYEFFRGQSHAGSPKIHLLLDYRDGVFYDATKEHRRFVEKEVEDSKFYSKVSQMAKIDALSSAIKEVDKYWPLIEKIAKSSDDEYVKLFFDELRVKHHR